MKFGQWLGFFCLLVSLYVLWAIRQLLLLIFTAVIFATAFNRIVFFLQRFGIKRNLAIALTLISSFILATLFFVSIVPPFIEQFQNLIALLPVVWETIREQLTNLKQQQLQLDWLPPLPTQADLIAQLQPFGTVLFRNFFAFFSNS
ncbi:MAG: AI-2E family transporter, partial [Hydrococcus sp. RM1_1_31]|nr:AI-2E family transporter [Hydrococcus sp. RM1_1_31]